jgi:hypothetical protein
MGRRLAVGGRIKLYVSGDISSPITLSLQLKDKLAEYLFFIDIMLCRSTRHHLVNSKHARPPTS